MSGETISQLVSGGGKRSEPHDMPSMPRAVIAIIATMTIGMPGALSLAAILGTR